MNAPLLALCTLLSTSPGPFGKECEPPWQMLITQKFKNDVRRFDLSDGSLVDYIIAKGVVPELDNDFNGCALAPDGTLLIADQLRVWRFDARSGKSLGEIIDVEETGGGVIWEIVVRNGLLYVVMDDSGLGLVRRYDATSGVLIDTMVPAGSGGLSGSRNLAFSPDGALLVSSFNTNRVLKYDGQSGAFQGVFVAPGNGLNNPAGLIFDLSGDLLVASRESFKILRYDGQTGAFLGEFAPNGELNGRPNNMVLGPDGVTLYVSTQPVTGAAVERFDIRTGVRIGDAVHPASQGGDECVGFVFAKTPYCSATCCAGDLDGDGLVSGSDLGLLLSEWGICK